MLLFIAGDVIFGVGFALLLAALWGLHRVLYSMPVQTCSPSFFLTVIVSVYPYKALTRRGRGNKNEKPDEHDQLQIGSGTLGSDVCTQIIIEFS